MNQGSWAAEIDGSFNEDEASCDSSSRAEPKRSHQLFADGSQLGLFPNKRQALGVPNTTLLPGMLNPNSAAWGHGFCFNPFSSRFSEWLFAPEGGKNGDLEDRNTSSVGLDKLSDDRKLDEGPYDMLVTDGHAVSAGTVNDSRKKDDLKTSSNSFPSNVRSLLSTGMLDGVSVKYIAWSREKELRGIIKGTGYLCGCQTCNFSKVVNAYEFERHANCKTKHPNNHIYCESGKTIYGIVQELRSTPQNMLFDVIQTITGSTINQKSFDLWKESFQAATLELQRIYPKE